MIEFIDQLSQDNYLRLVTKVLVTYATRF